MRVTKFAHACVRLEQDGEVLVIDPAVWSEPRALTGATAALLTHEHADHVDAVRLRGLGVPVFAPAGATIEGLSFQPVNPGEELTVGGMKIRSVGGRHATIYGGELDCANLGYVINETLYHPGDSLSLPDVPIDLLFAPMQASWLKLQEAVDFIRAVAPRRAIGIHDAQLNPFGIAGAVAWFTKVSGTDYRRVEPGTVKAALRPLTVIRGSADRA